MVKYSNYFADLSRRLGIINDFCRDDADLITFSVQKLPLGYIMKRNGAEKELVELYPKPKWDYVNPLTGQGKRRPGNIICYNPVADAYNRASKNRRFGVVLEYVSGGIQLSTKTGEVFLTYPQEIEYFENFHSFASYLGVGWENDRTKLNVLGDIYDLLDCEGLKDNLIPGDRELVRGFTPNGAIEYSWPSMMGFDMEKGVAPLFVKTNSLFRVGYLGGTNFTTSKLSYDKLAIPYRSNPYAMNEYKFSTHLYDWKMKAVAHGNLNLLNKILYFQGNKELDKEEFKKFEEFYDTYQSKLILNNLSDKAYYKGISGYAAPWYHRGKKIYSGGAIQITTPLDGFKLERLGILYPIK